MAKDYGSVVLTQDSPGHCSIAAFSACTIAAVKRYFLTGDLPPEGVVCPIDQVPFGHGPGETLAVAMTEETRLGIQMYEQGAAALYATDGGLMQRSLRGRIASWI